MNLLKRSCNSTPAELIKRHERLLFTISESSDLNHSKRLQLLSTIHCLNSLLDEACIPALIVRSLRLYEIVLGQIWVADEAPLVSRRCCRAHRIPGREQHRLPPPRPFVTTSLQYHIPAGQLGGHTAHGAPQLSNIYRAGSHSLVARQLHGSHSSQCSSSHRESFLSSTFHSPTCPLPSRHPLAV